VHVLCYHHQCLLFVFPRLHGSDISSTFSHPCLWYRPLLAPTLSYRFGRTRTISSYFCPYPLYLSALALLDQLSCKCRNHLNLPRLKISETDSILTQCLNSSDVILFFTVTPHIHLTIILSALGKLCLAFNLIGHVLLPYTMTLHLPKKIESLPRKTRILVQLLAWLHDKFQVSSITTVPSLQKLQSWHQSHLHMHIHTHKPWSVGSLERPCDGNWSATAVGWQLEVERDMCMLSRYRRVNNNNAHFVLNDCNTITLMQKIADH